MLIRMISATIRWFIHLFPDPISKASNKSGLLNLFLDQHLTGKENLKPLYGMFISKHLLLLNLHISADLFRCCWSPFFADTPCPWIYQFLLSRGLIVARYSATCHETLQTRKGNFISINICSIHSKVRSMSNVWLQLVP